MKIRKGKKSSRIVFLISTFAFKVVRPRLIGFIVRMLLLPFATRRNRKMFFDTYGKNFFRSFIKYSLFGLHANLYEYHYSKKYNDPDTMPVLKIYFFGWILVQRRGNDNIEKNFVSPFIKFGLPLSPETTGWCQYCKLKGKVFLIDYGDIATIRDLLKTQHLRTVLKIKSP
mgnify:FL=1